MSQSNPDGVASAQPEADPWRSLYNAGAMAALISVGIILVSMVGLFTRHTDSGNTL